MANAVIVVERADGSSLHGIFHMHADSGTNTLASAGAFGKTRWEPLGDYALGWKPAWCEMIGDVYPEELKAQACPAPFKSGPAKP